jgi:DNA-binding PucR family transcriptional regulator
MALELMQHGAIPAGAPAFASEHLAAMILLQDGEMARTLIERRLEALNVLPEAERERLIETLRSWLEHQRHTPGIAAELHVHPQTVRYRVGKLRELLGDALDTPDGRFELELALRARDALELQRS